MITTTGFALIWYVDATVRTASGTERPHTFKLRNDVRRMLGETPIRTVGDALRAAYDRADRCGADVLDTSAVRWETADGETDGVS